MMISRVQNNSPKTFTGYDARRLKGFVMNSNYAGIASDMKRIGDIEGFKVYLFSGTVEKPRLTTEGFKIDESLMGCWAQDMWGIVKKTLLSCEDSVKSETLKKLFGLDSNAVQSKTRKRVGLQQLKDSITDNSKDVDVKTNKSIYKDMCRRTHIKGGNYFIAKGDNGEDELLIGSNELKQFKLDDLKAMFKIDKIHVIPQADYHLDLFMRPLKDKKVLVADDETMLETLSIGYDKIKKTVDALPDSEKLKFADALYSVDLMKSRFQNILKANPYTNIKEVEKTLTESGYEVIKVPGRIFDVEQDYNIAGTKTYLRPLHNYLNANVHINDDGQLIYITNSSIVDYELGLNDEIQKMTGFSLKKAFWDAVRPHVNKVYFVSGRKNAVQDLLLREYLGGIHCVAAEVPL